LASPSYSQNTDQYIKYIYYTSKKFPCGFRKSRLLPRKFKNRITAEFSNTAEELEARLFERFDQILSSAKIFPLLKFPTTDALRVKESGENCRFLRHKFLSAEGYLRGSAILQICLRSTRQLRGKPERIIRLTEAKNS
jgi:hypothetical protein